MEIKFKGKKKIKLNEVEAAVVFVFMVPALVVIAFIAEARDIYRWATEENLGA